MAEVDPAVAAAAAAAYEDDEDDEDDIDDEDEDEDEDNIDDEDEDEDEDNIDDENVDVAAAVAAAAAANDGTAELAAATAEVLLPGDFPVGPCAGINGFLSVIRAEPLLRSLNHAGRAGVARWSQTRPSRARRAALSRSSARARARAPPSLARSSVP